MPTLLAISLAGSLAYLANRLLVKRTGSLGVVVFAPILEELLKTGSSLLLTASLYGVHLGFGALEALLDFLQRPRPLPLVGYLAALCSIFGHGAFAAVTLWGWSVTGRLMWGLLFGCGLHLLWNVWIAGLVKQAGEGRS